MSRKMLNNKILLWSVIGLLVTSIGLVTYYDFLK
jgi:hypothetical protein